MSMDEYDAWLADPTPENLATTVQAMDPVIVSEVQRYSGPKPLLRAKAKGLTIRAIQTYDPTRGAALRTWVTTQLKPLSRYSQRMRPVRVPEAATRRAAELHSIGLRMAERLGHEPTNEELSDEVGLSLDKIEKLQRQSKPALTESQILTPMNEEDTPSLPAVDFPSPVGFSSEAVYQTLSKRQQTIYDWKTGSHGKRIISNKEIARRLGVTPALVTQISRRIAQEIQGVSEHVVQ